MTDEKRGRGRPKHEPTEVTRKLAETMSGYGMPQEDIAREIGIHHETLRIHYRDELDGGVAKANAKVAQSLYQKALGDGSSAVTAAIFWQKTRAGWKETVVNEHTGKDGGPMESRVTLDPSKLSDAAMAEILNAATDES